MRMRHVFILLLVLLGPLPAQALTLEEVVAAVKNHPSIEASRWDAKRVKSEKHATAWLPDPKVGVEIDEVPLRKKSPGNALMTTYSVSQAIPFPGTLVAKSRALDAEYRAKLAMTTQVERDRIFDAKKTYFALIANKSLLAAEQNVINALNQLVTSSSSAYATRTETMTQPSDAGMSEAPTPQGSGFGDVLMARMKKAEAQARLHDLHHQEDALKAQLNLLMGRAPDADLGKLKTPPLKRISIPAPVLEQKLIGQNADLKSLNWMTQKAKRDVTAARLEKVPMLEPMVGWEQRQNMENAYMASLNLNLPIWINRNMAETNRAKAEAQRAKMEYQAREREAKSDLYYLYNHALWHRQIVDKYRGEIVPLAQSAVNAGREAYAANLETSSSLLVKIIGLSQAQAMYWNMWMDYQTEFAQLEAMLGEEL